MEFKRTILAGLGVLAITASGPAFAQATGPVYTCSKSVKVSGTPYVFEIASLRLLPGNSWDVAGDTMRFGGGFISVKTTRPFDSWTPTAAGRALIGPKTIRHPSLILSRSYRMRGGVLELKDAKIAAAMPNYIWGDSGEAYARRDQKGRWLLLAGGKSLVDVRESYGVIARTPAYIETIAFSTSQPRPGRIGYQPALDGLSASGATLEIHDGPTLLGSGAIGPVRPRFEVFDQIAKQEVAVFARPGSANPAAQGCVPR